VNAHPRRLALAAGLCLIALAASAGCNATSSPVGQATPIYNPKTGKLSELTMDRNGDGRVDMWVTMDGVHLQSIRIDRHGTGQPDRWEYYTQGSAVAGSQPSAGSLFDAKTVIVRAEEANGPDPKKITRWEYYTDGVLVRVDEDTDFDGRIDEWETYEHGALARMDLDLKGRGKPDERFVYGSDGSLDHVEVDVAGDGHFVRDGAPSPSAPAAGVAVARGKGGDE
jgi:hypothetical protein